MVVSWGVLSLASLSLLLVSSTPTPPPPPPSSVITLPLRLLFPRPVVVVVVVTCCDVRMFPSSFRSMGPGRRKDSAIRTLVAETLVLAKTHGCVEKIESELEEELRRESGGQANDPLSKWRRKGDKALKSKYVLLTVALFCVTDCALVLGELILDLHRVKDTLETTERTMDEFKETLHATYPNHVPDVTIDISEVFDLITRSRILWVNSSIPHPHNLTLAEEDDDSLLFPSSSSSPAPSSGRPPSGGGHLETGSLLTSSSTTARSVISVRRRRSRGRGVEEETEYIVVVQQEKATSEEKKRTLNNESSAHAQGAGAHGKGKQEYHSLEEEIAHAFHVTSVTLMAILMFESLLKAFCAGLSFFKRKLETFDLFILVVSFTVDVVFMQILPRFKIQDFVFILAFLLPWRVIRVVNSLVVAVQDHEHFRLKMVYSRKKKIQNSLRETEVKLQLFRAQCCALKRLCLNEGVEECKIEEIVQLDEYVVNRTGKSKCKVKIDNTSVILLDKSDFPMGPRGSQLALRDKRRSLRPADSAKELSGLDKLDPMAKRNGHGHSVATSLEVPSSRDGKWKGMGRKLSMSFSNGPLSSLFGHRTLDAVPEDGESGGLIPVRRTSSQGLICAAIKRDLFLLKGGSAAENGHSVKPEGNVEHKPGHVTAAKDDGMVSHSSAEKEELPRAPGEPSAGERLPKSGSLPDVPCSSLASSSVVDGRVCLSGSSQPGQDSGVADDSGHLSETSSPSGLASTVNETRLSDHENNQLVNPSYAVSNGNTAASGSLVPNGTTVPSVPFHMIEDSVEPPRIQPAEHPELSPGIRPVPDTTCRGERQESPPAVLAVSQGQAAVPQESPPSSQASSAQVLSPADSEKRVLLKDSNCVLKEGGHQVPEQRSPELDLPVVPRSASSLSEDRLSDVTVVGDGVDKDSCLMTPTNDLIEDESSHCVVEVVGHSAFHSDDTDLLCDEEKSEVDTEPTSSVSQDKASESETVSTICDSLLSLPPLEDSSLLVVVSETPEDSNGEHADTAVTPTLSSATSQEEGQSVTRTMLPHATRET